MKPNLESPFAPAGGIIPAGNKVTARARWLALLLAVPFLVVLDGCSVRNYALNRIGDTLAASGSTYATDDDPELIRGAAPFSLKLMESVLAEAPDHAALLAAASRGFTQYAYAFVQEDADESEQHDVSAARAKRVRARKLYLRARDYGLRALETSHPGFSGAVKKDAKLALAQLSRDDSTPLYWTAVSWAAAIALSTDSPEAIAELRVVDAMIAALLKLDPDIDSGALHTFLISYEMGRPGARNPQASAREQFAQAIRLSHGQKAAPYVAFAESVCVATQDRREFVANLKLALAINPSARPEWTLENSILQRRARWLLTQTDQLFLD